MTITCPHCAGALPIAGKLDGDRAHCARCGGWVLVARRASGERYGVKVQPPKVYKQVKPDS
jgi:DNA-directed RNA polymerase subunit RPC12/RpoP